MNLIKIVALPSGAHENRNSQWETTVPDGWAIIQKNVTIPKASRSLILKLKKLMVFKLLQRCLDMKSLSIKKK